MNFGKTLFAQLMEFVPEKTLISCALQIDDYKTEPLPDANQLILLEF